MSPTQLRLCQGAAMINFIDKIIGMEITPGNVEC